MGRALVLILEDDPDLREIFSDLVERMGGLPVAVERPDQALVELENKKISMIICDQNLPKMKGMDFLDLIRAKGFNMRFVLMSGGEIQKIDVVIEKDKNFKFLMKPVFFDELVDEFNKANRTEV